MCVMQGFTPNAYLRGDVRDTHVSIKQISKRLGIAYATAWKYVKALEEE